MRLELLHHLMAIIDQREPGALAATILCPEAEAGDLVLVGFVELGEFGAEFVLGDVGTVRVENVAVRANAISMTGTRGRGFVSGA